MQYKLFLKVEKERKEKNYSVQRNQLLHSPIIIKTVSIKGMHAN